MIICPNCNHHNPDGSTQCENCYTPLPQTTTCPNCGASVQTDATFCGQCGFNLQVEMIEPGIDMSEPLDAYPELTDQKDTETLTSVPTETISSPFQSPWDEDTTTPKPLETVPLAASSLPEEPTEEKELEQEQFAVANPWDIEEPEEKLGGSEELEELEELPELSASEELFSLVDSIGKPTSADLGQTESAEAIFSATPPPQQELEDLAQPEEVEPTPPISSPELRPVAPPPPPIPNIGIPEVSAATQLQLQEAKLIHVQTNTVLEINPNLSVVHIGKPNRQIPPDIDVSGFANSDVVSRIHADIRVEGDAYFIEDVGSSNGTYINHSPLLVGNRHRLRPGDRIALGKGDLVTFIFQLNE